MSQKRYLLFAASSNKIHACGRAWPRKGEDSMETLILECSICGEEIILHLMDSEDRIVARAAHIDCAVVGGARKQ